MRALVFADRQGLELSPLTETMPVALLPVVGKAVLIHGIEELVAAGIRDLTLVVSAHAEQIEAALGRGERWGANFRFVLSRGEEDPAEMWRRLSLGDQDPVLVLRGDVLRGAGIEKFLQLAQGLAGTSLVGVPADPRGAAILLRPGSDERPECLSMLRWSQPLACEGLEGGRPWEVALACLEDLRAYHQANLDGVAGRIPGLRIPGRTLALGLSLGRRAKVSPRSLKQGVAFVGANSRVHPQAELLGEVVISEDVVVDSAATIRDSLILPKTYVGELVEVSHAIVASNRLIRVDTGAIVHISDAFLLADLSSPALSGGFGRWLHRIGGGALLLLSLPLWPLAVVGAALGGPGDWLESQILEGNPPPPLGGISGDRHFIAWNWRTGIPVLRYLPWLLAVVQGHIRLVGVSPLTPEQSASRVEEWEKVRDLAPVGLLGPTQLTLTMEAPLEERLISDAFYARQRSLAKDLGYLWQGLRQLFSREAWRH